MVKVPNRAVAVDAWARSACYPRGSFYPMIDATSHSNASVHYYLLSYLLGSWPSQSSWLMQLHVEARFPSWLSQPLYASVTLYEATAPVKLPIRHCPRFIGRVSTPHAQERYFTVASTFPERNASKAPSYATHAHKTCNAKL